jgi:hypothetical protein
MPLRHYQGSIPTARAVWVCPTCHQENSTPLEAGCPHCRAGADARRAMEAPVRIVPTASGLPPAEEAFEAWLVGYAQNIQDYPVAKVAKDAFMAGIAWVEASGYAIPHVTGGTAGPVVIHSVWNAIDFHDPLVRATLAAALAFYIDNQLRYGSVPGQLGVEDARVLLAQLQQPEDPTRSLSPASTYSTEDVLHVLHNSGVDTDCGACMEVAFTGVTTNQHICRQAAQTPLTRSHD